MQHDIQYEIEDILYTLKQILKIMKLKNDYYEN